MVLAGWLSVCTGFIMAGTTTFSFDAVLAGVRERARSAGVFGEIAVKPVPGAHGPALVCAAAASAAPAEYRVYMEETARGVSGGVWVALVTEDRWLSQSIEADLVHTGDKLEELLDEELAEQDYPSEVPSVEHFRSDDKLYTFRSALSINPASTPVEEAADLAARALLAYEACFRELGDMEADEDE